eukprot:scaffold17.g482.t1
MGGLTAACQLATKGAKVVVLEKYIIPGGSAGHFERQGFTFDVGSSMMFGMGSEGTTNLITRALAGVGQRVDTVPDPTQIHYHLPRSAAHPEGLEVRVWRDYERFVAELSTAFPHEAAGIRAFYGDCWKVFNALNSLELKSLEEPRYLLEQFVRAPLACLTLVTFVATNAGDAARKYIKDPELLSFIDIECYCWSTVLADLTPMINAGTSGWAAGPLLRRPLCSIGRSPSHVWCIPGERTAMLAVDTACAAGMVFCDRHFGGINYPVGGVGIIPERMARGLQEHGGRVEYKANVKEILVEGEGEAARAVGVRLADGRVYRGKTVISNATRWDTFEGLIGEDKLPPSEALFRGRYVKAPSFLSIHMGVRADVLPAGTDCHHIVVEDWAKMMEPYGTLFVSIPSLLDPSICPPGTHVFHAFSPDWIDAWQGLPPEEYTRKKNEVADAIVARLEALFPGLKEATVFRRVREEEVGTPRTHRRFLNRVDGSYGPIPSRRPLGMLSMPFNRTGIQGLYCVGDSTFPGQGVNAVVFSGFGCAHRVLCDLGKEPRLAGLDEAYNAMLQAVLLAPIRADIVTTVHTHLNKNKRQAYAVSAKAGHQTAAESWGTGRAVSRIPRVPGGGTHRAGQAAFGNMTRGGHMYSSTKTWRRWHRKVNVNQKRYAVVSALAASALPALVLARGHRIEQVPEVPLVISDAVESLTKTKAAVELLKKVGAYADVEKAAASKNLRRGKGKMRNRRYVARKGPLVIYGSDAGVSRAFRNLPGVEVASVDRLNLLQLAPGGHLGRFCIWTKSAFEKLDSIFGTVEKESEQKKGYKLPRHIMTNGDLARVINSDEVQSVVRAPKASSARAPLKKNPLRNLGALLKLNPHAKAARRAQLLADARAAARAEKLAAARKAARKESKKIGKAFYGKIVTDADYVGEDYDEFSNWLGTTVA